MEQKITLFSFVRSLYPTSRSSLKWKTRKLDHNNNLYHWITLGGRLRRGGRQSPLRNKEITKLLSHLIIYVGQMFWPLSIVPMLTCRQTDIFGTTYNRSQWYELLMSYGKMYYGGQKWGKSNRIEIFRQIFRFFTRLLDYYLYLCLNYLPTNCQDG